MKIFSEVSISVSEVSISVSSKLIYVHIDEHTLHLTSVKVDDPKMAKIGLSQKQSFVFKFVYFYEF